MKIIGLKDFNVKWMRNRYFLCYLPTELVLSKPNEDFHIRGAFYYYTDYPRVLREGEFQGHKYTQHVAIVAIEVHEDYGSDGHTDHVFRDKFILLEETEVPKNFEEYRDLLDKAYAEREKSKESQLTFNDFKRQYVYSPVWY